VVFVNEKIVNHIKSPDAYTKRREIKMTKHNKRLTNNFGAPVPDDQNSMTAGNPGPVLMQDVHLLEKLAHFDRERIPERVVHAKGAGAYGYFEVLEDVSQYTRAKFLSEVGKQTDVFIRFSTVGGEKGSADAERDPRGFALKFYTEDGNYDMVGNNTPIFFIRDPLKFPDFIHTQKRNPITNLKDADMFWDFLSLTPESIHQVTVLFSDRGTPRTYRHMNGYSSHTFMWYNENNEHYWVKYHFKTEQGIENFTREEADQMKSADPDHATRDLFDAIESGDYPTWRLEMQIMTPQQAKDYRFDPFDITKVWPHGDFEPITIGRMTLNRNPVNYFNEVEQSAFSPANFVPGIGPSPDKMLQGRLFSYHDTHRHRLGPNYHMLPVNAPKATGLTNYQRDGFMNISPGSGHPNYYPNSMGGVEPDPAAAEPTLGISGDIARQPYTHPNDDFVQAGDLYRKVMTDEDRANLIGNIVSHLSNAQKRIQLRQTVLFYRADTDYGKQVAKGLGLDVDKIESLASMSQEQLVEATKE
jgi:catalase